MIYKPPRLVVVHCSATPPSMDIGAKEIRQWHLDRGFSDIGYHWVIRRSGKLEEGRPERKTPAAQRGFNACTLTICLVGGINKHRDPKWNFRKPQLKTLRNHILDLRERYDIVSIYGHRDFPDVAKACPSGSIAGWVYQTFIMGERL